MDLKYGFICALGLACIACSPTYAPDLSTGDRLLWAEVHVPPTPVVSDGLLSTGARVFQETCVACHGENGHGDGPEVSALTAPPRDFSLALFKLRTTTTFPSDTDLYRSITVGFPAYGMPANETLSPEDRWALVYHVKALVQVADEARALETGAVINLPPAKEYSQRSIDLGKILYNKMACALCHGAKGEASATMALVDAQGNSIQPRNFQAGPETFKGGGRPEDIVRILMTGMAGTPMQSYARIGTDNQQLWDLAHYVHYLATNTEKESP